MSILRQRKMLTEISDFQLKINHLKTLLFGIFCGVGTAAAGLPYKGNAHRGSINHMAVSYLHTAVEIEGGKHPHLVCERENAFVAAYVILLPASCLSLAGHYDVKPYVRIKLSEAQNGLGGKQVKASGAPVIELGKALFNM